MASELKWLQSFPKKGLENAAAVAARFFEIISAPLSKMVIFQWGEKT